MRWGSSFVCIISALCRLWAKGMLDFGWPELLLVMALAVLVIGPDEIPSIMVGIGRVFRRFQYIKFALSQQFEDIMREADLDDLRKSVNFEDKDFDESEDEYYALMPPEKDHEKPGAAPEKEKSGSDE